MSRLQRLEFRIDKIRKEVVTDEASRPVAVQIDYSDWLGIERSLGWQGSRPRVTDLSSHYGLLTLPEEPPD
jgi:hypothetical protein